MPARRSCLAAALVLSACLSSPAAPEDAAPVEDAAVVVPPPSRCVAQFGTIFGFELCEEAGTECTFFTFTDGRSCGEICEAVGGMCTGAIDNVSFQTCEYDVERFCNTSAANDLICRCTPVAALRCEQLYGGLPGFGLCAADAEGCEFTATTGEGSCAELCEGRGATCLDARRVPAGSCGPGEAAGCDASGPDQVCRCSGV